MLLELEAADLANPMGWLADSDVASPRASRALPEWKMPSALSVQFCPAALMASVELPRRGVAQCLLRALSLMLLQVARRVL